MDRLLLSLIALGVLTAFARSADPPPLKIHFIGVGEYEPEKSLADLRKQMEEKYRVECTASLGGDGKKLENLDSLKSADVMVLFARRMSLKEEQMAIIRKHWEQGKPIVGIRTASHAFQKDDNEIFDKKVLGGNYGGDSSNGGFKPIPAEKMADHPILKGVGEFKANKYSYGQGKMSEKVVVLQVVDRKKDFPVTWLHEYNGGRIFYTSMGAPEDFKDENFRQFIINAIFWTTKRDPDKMKK